MHDAAFSRFRAANPDRLHFAAHSHHPWPDATEAAHARYWTDSATLADRKWERILGEVLPAAQDHVARKLSLSDARQVAFAPNTHEFVARLYSCFGLERPIRVLTTAHEFHSFTRQTRRLEEAGRVEVTRVPLEPWETFDARFAAAPRDALIAIDGYHAFCAIPVDLAAIHRRAFYLAGGYKYAMSGEGACFLAVPPGNRLRPVDTGWYASFDRLSQGESEVPYAGDAFRFWGATFDASGLYRFVAAMDWLDRSRITVDAIHRHATVLQKHFLDGCARRGIEALAPARLVPPPGAPRGNFLAFALADAEEVHRRIVAANVTIDRRGDRVRFGFGLYHDEAEVERLIDVVAQALT